ncbi:hypothetical protein JMJ35_002161 [Cladonia borealis]|uniref:Uncharacterized protein n=1 Tax=Cladonia borealis TaxID=184061 RepID=A0AA39R726_9LECA|nr:hypothetical protein JMJ35_002161 [Cladonia borealis]
METGTRPIRIFSRPMGPGWAQNLQKLFQKLIEPNRNDLLDFAAIDYEDIKKMEPLPHFTHHWAVGIGEKGSGEKVYHLQANTANSKVWQGWPIEWQETTREKLQGDNKVELNEVEIGQTNLTNDEIEAKGGTLPFEPHIYSSG